MEGSEGAKEGALIFLLSVNYNFALVCVERRGSGCAAPARCSSPVPLSALASFPVKNSGVKRGSPSALAFQKATSPSGLGLFSSLSAAGHLRGNGKKMSAQRVDFALGLISRAGRRGLSAGGGLVEGQK